MDKKYIYVGNVEIQEKNASEWAKKLNGIKEITGYLYIYSNASLEAKALKSVGGDLYINSNASLEAKALKSVGGDLYIDSKNDDKLERRLWQNNRNNQWHLTNRCSDFLLSQKGKIKYRINNVAFDKPLFDRVRKDEFSAQEVFAITNIEQRRIAYEFMDKIKMKELKDFKILHQEEDNQNNLMQVVSFVIPGFDKPFRYLHCICPSTRREYYLETQQYACELAKAKSFGLDKIEFDIEV